MNDRLLLSVITPVINGEKHIQQCIEGIINQSCPHAEHVIVDGQSSDRTVAIIRDYAAQYDHIRWISEKDKGQSDALNKGVAMAKGNILGLLNVDDFYEPDVLNRILEIFETLPKPSLLVGNCNVWDHDGELLYINRPSRLKITDLLVGFSVHPHPVNPSAYFYEKSIHDTIGLFRTDEVAQDIPFIFSAVQVAHVTYVDETWGNWRKFKGTQTVREQEDGSAFLRKKRIMAEYYGRLSVGGKMVVLLKKLFYRMKGSVRKLLTRLRILPGR
jgi:glycosyltransferase involved in cell wall biosynthesis